MTKTKFTLTALLFLSLSFTACEVNDVKALWTATFDSNTSAETSDNVERMTVESNGDIIMIGTGIVLETANRSENLLILKYNASGTKLWDFKNNFPASEYIFINDYCVDTQKNIYVSGTLGSDLRFLVKVSSAGQLIWQNVVQEPSELNGAILSANGKIYWGSTNIAVVDPASGTITGTMAVKSLVTDMVSDSAGNIYAAGSDYYASFTAAGTLRFSNSWGMEIRQIKLAMASNDTLYATSEDMNTSNVRTFKISNTGSIVARANETINNAWNMQLSLDKSGNVIIAFSRNNAKTRTVVKYNSNLTKTWLKDFTASSDTMDLNQMIVDNSGNIYITGRDLTTKINTSGSKVASETDSSFYYENRIGLSPDNTKMYIATSTQDGETRIELSQYNNK